MSKFDIRLTDRQTGQILSEKMEAANEEEVRVSAELRGLTLLSSSAQSDSWLHRDIGGPKRIKTDDLASFARMYASVVQSGVPPMRALEMAKENTEHPTMRDVLSSVVSSVASGSKTSDAFGEHPDVFPPVMVATIAAGEGGGKMSASLVQIADTLESDAKMKAEVRGAMTYPVLVLSMSLAITAGLSIFMMPMFEGMFAELGGELPLLTRIMMGISDAMIYIIPGIILASVLSWRWWRTNRYKPDVRIVVDKTLLRLPIFGKLLREVAVARVTRTLGLLMASAVQPLLALEQAANVAGNEVIARAVRSSIQYVQAGQPLSQHISEGDHIPVHVANMVKAGEESGKVPSMLLETSRYYTDRVEHTVKNLTSVLQPVMILMVGLVVGPQVIAMYLPMISMYDLM